MNYIDKIVNLIIRPTRDHYHIKRLADPQININTPTGQHIKALRQDRVILNRHNEHIHLSYFAIQSISPNPFLNQYYYSSSHQITQNINNNDYNNLQQSQITFQSKVQNFKNKCVIYLHANNGSRIQGMTYLQKLIQAHCNVCLFDCSGSGISQGQYVTLGLKQARDLDCIVNFLMRQKKITQIILWGRSMGAGTGIIYGSKHSRVKISGIVLDSPFKDLEKLIIQIASDKTGLPKIFFKPLIPFIRAQILNKTGYNIEELKLKRYIEKDKNISSSGSRISLNQRSKETKDSSEKRINLRNKLSSIPALFIVSKKDKFVRCSHGQKLFKRYPCENKQIMYIDTQHHETRSQNDVDRIINFIVTNFNLNITKGQQNQKPYPLKFTKNVLVRSRLDTRRTVQKNSPYNLSSPQKKINLNQTFQNFSFTSPSYQQNQYHPYKTQLNQQKFPIYQPNLQQQNTNLNTFSKNLNVKSFQNLINIPPKKTPFSQSYLINYKQSPSVIPFYQSDIGYLNQNSSQNQINTKLQSKQSTRINGNLKNKKDQEILQSFPYQNLKITQNSQISKKDGRIIHDLDIQMKQQQVIPHYMDKNTYKHINKGKISLSSMLSYQNKVKNRTNYNESYCSQLYKQKNKEFDTNLKTQTNHKFSGWVNENKQNQKASYIYSNDHLSKAQIQQVREEGSSIKYPYLSLSKASYQPFKNYKICNQFTSLKDNLNSQSINDKQSHDLSMKTSIIGKIQTKLKNSLLKDSFPTQNYTN